uniref:WH1 domain-containing protein n=1 Tax=Macrostomum lignano TaxID=282301 RepID=A0A1I8I9X7_9PLAT
MPAQVPTNKPSELLDNDENNLVFSLLGPKCITLATTVAQLYYGENNRWTHMGTGILCFVRDANVRSFFLRFYDIEQRKMLFEQEIYKNMAYDNKYAFFHQVEADNCVVGFNFVDDDRGQDEAHELYEVLKAKVDKMSTPAVARQQNVQTAPVVIGRQASISNSAGQPQTLTSGAAPKKSTSSAGKSDKAEKRKGGGGGGAGRGRIRREDIGTPTNFRHVQHVGYDTLSEADGGGDIQRVEIANDPVLKFLFGQIGENFEQTMQTKKGARKVEQFITNMGGIDKVRQMATDTGYAPAPGNQKQQQQQQPQPPPPPSRAARKLPGRRRRCLPSVAGGRAPPPPPPPSRLGAPPPPPPPPPQQQPPP